MEGFRKYLFPALEGLKQPVFVLDSELSCVFVNRALCDFLELQQDESETVSLDTFWPEARADLLDVPEVSVTLRGSNNMQLPLKLSLTPLCDSYTLCRVLDESDVHEPLFHSQRLMTLGMLAGGVAHDFNNVLAGILGHITYLKTILPRSGPHCESLAAIEEGGKKASLMTQQILNFSKLNTEEKPVRVDVCDIVLKTWSLLRGAISPEYNLSHRVPDAPLYVMAVEGKLAQVIVNLVMNSKDAIEVGKSIDIVVEELSRSDRIQQLFGAESASSCAVLKVKDDGHGMSEEVLSHAFEPYYSTKKKKGTGLGLATVRSIVDALGGAIDIQSQVGSGTSVSVYLPLADVSDALASSDHASSSELSLEQGTERILVVDDEDPVRNVLCVSLAHLGYEVERACSGAEALEMVESHGGPRYDLVILDMLMPNLSGDEVFFRLREIEPAIRVLLISGYSSEEAVHRILENGGRGFIQKPFTIDELSRKVRECFRNG